MGQICPGRGAGGKDLGRQNLYGGEPKSYLAIAG